MAVDNKVVSSVYSEHISSMHDFAFPDQILMKLYSQYGSGNLARDLMRKFGNERMVGNDFLKAHYEGKAFRTITLDGDTTVGGSAGAAVVLTISADDADSQGNIFVRVGDDILYKHIDNKIYPLRVESISGLDITVKPLDSTITVAVIADATELSVGGNSFADHTGQPTGLTRGLFEDTFYARLSKESMNMTGGELAKERWHEVMDDGGNKLYWSKAYADTEFSMDVKEEMGAFLGQKNTNSIVQSSKNSVNNAVQSGDGWWKIMDNDAGKLNYGTGTFSVSEFDNIETYLRSQHITSGVLNWMVGAGLRNKLSDAGIDFSKTNSGGTDFTKIVNAGFDGDEAKALNMNFDMFTRGSFTHMINVLDTFSNPDLLGNDTYDFNDSAMITPLGGKVKDKSTFSMLDNIGIAYVNHNGVNRKRVIGTVNGMSGMPNMPIQNEYDGIDVYMLSHFIPYMVAANQTMQALPLA